MTARGRVRAKLDATNQGQSPPPPKSSLLHADRLRQLYAALLRCRISGKMSRGREAMVAAATLELGPDDHLLPRHACELAGRIKNSGIGNDESLSDTSRLILAAGVALGLKMTRRPGIVMALAKDSEMDGGFRHVLAFAAQSKLPNIYLLESAEAKSMKVNQPSRVPVILVEGSDAVAILRVIQECARRARQGHGPALIRCSRPTSDPLKFMEDYLRKRSLWSEEWLRKLEAEMRARTRKEKKTS